MMTMVTMMTKYFIVRSIGFDGNNSYSQVLANLNYHYGRLMHRVCAGDGLQSLSRFSFGGAVLTLKSKLYLVVFSIL